MESFLILLKNRKMFPKFSKYDKILILYDPKLKITIIAV